MNQTQKKITVRGELALLTAVLINTMSVVLMLWSGAGMPAISSVPYAFSAVLPQLTLGTWTYLFQGMLVAGLMLLRRKVVPSYLFSFVVGFVFGKVVDVHTMWITQLPRALPVRVIAFAAGYLLLSTGIALANRCRLPIVPNDLFPRELARIRNVAYDRVKITFDVGCLLVTVGMTLVCLGQISGIGVGTVLAAVTMGKTISWIGAKMDRRLEFVSVLEPHPVP